ncbi:Ubiquitin-like protein [Thelotrema lepadinum]|nr:Ubiquitin-like protein [Thelotrema lepadinum]
MPSPARDTGGTTVPDDPQSSTTLPLPMAASVVLSSLPTDAATALARAQKQAEGEEGGKVKIRLHPLGSAPPLTSRVFKISASNRFESVVLFLRRKLGLQSHEGVVCYVNSVFAPGLDEGVGGLWRCFKQGSAAQGDEVLVVAYSLTPAFG